MTLTLRTLAALLAMLALSALWTGQALGASCDAHPAAAQAEHHGHAPADPAPAHRTACPMAAPAGGCILPVLVAPADRPAAPAETAGGTPLPQPAGILPQNVAPQHFRPPQR